MRAFLLIALLALPMAQANATELIEQQNCVEPCGWIEPLIDIVIPEKPACGGGRPILPGERPTDCLTIPDDGESVTLQGMFTMKWDAAEEPFYPIPPGETIDVSFSGVPNNMRFLDFTVDPPTWSLDNNDVALGTEHHCLDSSDPTRVVFNYCYSRDIAITITRNGDAMGQEVRSINDRNGIVSFMIKGETSETSDGRYKPAFTIEDIRFDYLGSEPVNEGEESPSIGWLAGVAVLGAAFVRTKRRN